MKVKKLYEDSKLPVRSNPTDSGMDVFAHNIKKYYKKVYYYDYDMANIRSSTIEEEEYMDNITLPLILNPTERVLIGTGISCTVGKGYEIQVRPRSGLALKHGISIVNTPGTIDESYRGEIGVILINLSNKKIVINKNDKIAQLVITPVVLCNIEEVKELDDTLRGEGGFGSTGI